MEYTIKEDGKPIAIVWTLPETIDGHEVMWLNMEKGIWLPLSRNIESMPDIAVNKKKENIPAKLRWEIWERDNFTCLHCGVRKNLSIDHIIPESKGGTLDPANLQTLCKPCNSKKGTK